MHKKELFQKCQQIALELCGIQQTIEQDFRRLLATHKEAMLKKRGGKSQKMAMP